MNAAREYTTVRRSVDAIQWTGENRDVVREFARPVQVLFHDRGWVYLASGSQLSGDIGDWLVREHDTNAVTIMPAKVFELLYEPASTADAVEPQEAPVAPTLADA